MSDTMPIPTANGKLPTPFQRRLAELEAKRPPGTDELEIGSAADPADVRGATMEDAAKIVSAVKYLVRDWVPYGMVTGVIAEPGVGKSAFVLDALAGPILRGGKWFTGARGPGKPGNVLWCGTEADLAITLDRMTKWKLPLARLILPFDDDPLGTITLTNDAHIVRIEALVNRYKTRLVVVDSLRGGHDTDENSSQVGRVLKALAGIAERTRAAVVVVHHTRKLSTDEEVSANASRGSNAILALMRAQLGIDRPDPDSPRCRVRMLKQNLGLSPKSIGFQVTNDGLQFGPPPERPKPPPKQKDKAADWLRSFMRPGWPYKVAEVIAAGERAGYPESTLTKVALYEVRVEKRTVHPPGGQKYSEWVIPSPPAPGMEESRTATGDPAPESRKQESRKVRPTARWAAGKGE